MRISVQLYIPILIFIIFLNIIFSTYFIAIFLVGIVYKIFLDCLRNEYFYLLGFTIFTFFIIENIHNLSFFSFTLISIFLYYFILPRIKHLFSSYFVREFIYLMVFYCLFYAVYSITHLYDFGSYLIFIVNFIVDIFLIGAIL